MTHSDDTAPFAYDGLDRTIHERARLAILSSLIAHDRATAFNDLKSACGLTDGNLSRHLQVLQESGIVNVHKQFEGTRPLTTITLTHEGRQRFLDYINVLEQVVKDASRASHPVNTKKNKPLPHAG